MRKLLTITAGSGFAVVAAATLGLANAQAEPATTPPAPAQPQAVAVGTPLANPLGPLLRPVGWQDCVNGIGGGVGKGALTGGVATIEAGGAGALPGGIAGGIIGGIDNC